MPKITRSHQPDKPGEFVPSAKAITGIYYCYGRVKITRSAGAFRTEDGKWSPWYISEDREYTNVSMKSLDRLHRVISEMVSNGRASIRLFDMSYVCGLDNKRHQEGAGYEVEF